MQEAARPIHTHNLDVLLKDLVESGRAMGIVIDIPPVQCWRKDPVTGAEKIPTMIAPNGEVITVSFPNAKLAKLYNLERARESIQWYTNSLVQILFNPNAGCDFELESAGPSVSSMIIAENLIPGSLEDSIASRFMMAMVRASQWGCAFEWHFHHFPGKYRADEEWTVSMDAVHDKDFEEFGQAIELGLQQSSRSFGGAKATLRGMLDAISRWF